MLLNYTIMDYVFGNEDLYNILVYNDGNRADICQRVQHTGDKDEVNNFIYS